MRPQFVFHTSSSLILTAPSGIGHVAIAVGGGRLRATSIGDASGPQAANRLARVLKEPVEDAPRALDHEHDERLAQDVLERFVHYLDGEAVCFDDVPIDVDHLSAFRQRVVRVCRAILRGETRTYGELAAAARSPGAARAVGQVMRGNRMPLVVPCHRVVAAGGKLGGFSAPQGLSLKRRLLALEHAAIVDDISTTTAMRRRPSAQSALAF